MERKQCDKQVAKVVKVFHKNDPSADTVRKAQANFYKAIQALSAPLGQKLEQTFKSMRDYWHDGSKLPSEEYARLVTELCREGFVETAETVFVRCIQSLGMLSTEEAAKAIPSARMATLWMKTRKEAKNVLLKAIAATWDAYYGTALCDFYAKTAPVKDVLGCVVRCLDGQRRPSYLPEANEVLKVILIRDRKNSLATAIFAEAAQSMIRIKVLLRALSSVPGAWEAYGRAAGRFLASDKAPGAVVNVVRPMEDFLRGSQTEMAEFVAKFLAHTTTTWRLITHGYTSGAQSVGDELTRLMTGVIIAGQASEGREMWVACTNRVIADKLLNNKTKVSLQAGLQVALALRAVQTDAATSDALWSLAFNLGVREIGKSGDAVVFNAVVYEDIRGGLLPGDQARVVRSGWQLGDAVLLRAQVEKG